MRNYGPAYEDRDIITDPLRAREIDRESGQMLSPCVEIDGQDAGGPQRRGKVEAYLLANWTWSAARSAKADAPTKQPCENEMPQASPLHFQR